MIPYSFDIVWLDLFWRYSSQLCFSLSAVNWVHNCESNCTFYSSSLHSKTYENARALPRTPSPSPSNVNKHQSRKVCVRVLCKSGAETTLENTIDPRFTAKNSKLRNLAVFKFFEKVYSITQQSQNKLKSPYLTAVSVSFTWKFSKHELTKDSFWQTFLVRAISSLLVTAK